MRPSVVCCIRILRAWQRQGCDMTLNGKQMKFGLMTLLHPSIDIVVYVLDLRPASCDLLSGADWRQTTGSSNLQTSGDPLIADWLGLTMSIVMTSLCSIFHSQSLRAKRKDKGVFWADGVSFKTHEGCPTCEHRCDRCWSLHVADLHIQHLGLLVDLYGWRLGWQRTFIAL